jgi:hypothetical protein
MGMRRGQQFAKLAVEPRRLRGRRGRQRPLPGKRARVATLCPHPDLSARCCRACRAGHPSILPRRPDWHCEPGRVVIAATGSTQFARDKCPRDLLTDEFSHHRGGPASQRGRGERRESVGNSGCRDVRGRGKELDREGGSRQRLGTGRLLLSSTGPWGGLHLFATFSNSRQPCQHQPAPQHQATRTTTQQHLESTLVGTTS